MGYTREKCDECSSIFTDCESEYPRDYNIDGKDQLLCSDCFGAYDVLPIIEHDTFFSGILFVLKNNENVTQYVFEKEFNEKIYQKLWKFKSLGCMWFIDFNYSIQLSNKINQLISFDFVDVNSITFQQCAKELWQNNKNHSNIPLCKRSIFMDTFSEEFASVIEKMDAVSDLQTYYFSNKNPSELLKEKRESIENLKLSFNSQAKEMLKLIKVERYVNIARELSKFILDMNLIWIVLEMTSANLQNVGNSSDIWARLVREKIIQRVNNQDLKKRKTKLNKKSKI